MALIINARVGEVLLIGDESCVRVEHKSGRMVRLACFGRPHIDIRADGIIPKKFTLGVTGEVQRAGRILDAVAAPAPGPLQKPENPDM